MNFVQMLPVEWTRTVRGLYNYIHHPCLKRKILRFYKDTNDAEIKEVTAFLRTHAGLHLIPYNFVDTYKKRKDIVVQKASNGRIFVLNESGDRLYFSSYFQYKNKVKSVYLAMLAEQDVCSPHHYFGQQDIGTGKIMFDVGAAEGQQSLKMIRSLKKLFLFECDEKWIEALKESFAPFQDKVVIVNKYVSDFSDESHITIDDVCRQYHVTPDFIKMDIEGAEIQALDGAADLIQSRQCRYWSICTYHRQEDEQNIRTKFTSDYDIEHSKGYMIHAMGGIQKPYLRRGVLNIQKKEQ